MLDIDSLCGECADEVVGITESGLDASFSFLLKSSDDFTFVVLNIEHDMLAGITWALWHADTELAAVSIDVVDLVSALVIDIQNNVATLERIHNLADVEVLSTLNKVDLKFWSAEAHECALARLDELEERLHMVGAWNELLMFGPMPDHEVHWSLTSREELSLAPSGALLGFEEFWSLLLTSLSKVGDVVPVGHLTSRHGLEEIKFLTDMHTSHLLKFLKSGSLVHGHHDGGLSWWHLHHLAALLHHDWLSLLLHLHRS